MSYPSSSKRDFRKGEPLYVHITMDGKKIKIGQGQCFKSGEAHFELYWDNILDVFINTHHVEITDLPPKEAKRIKQINK